jgi:hypothetical protein
MAARSAPSHPATRLAHPARAGRAPRVAAAALLCALGGAAAPAYADGPQAAVEMRIEGRTSTLFEGPVRTEGREIRASSDTSSRLCDGTNNGQHAAPGPTPTAAAVDAMTLTGQSFDGRWFGSIGDYLIERWGPEAAAEGQTWSLFANDVLSNVGGCQLELHEGAQVLWKLGFASAKPLLMLAPRATASGAPPLTASALPGVPFEVEVLAYHPGGESEPPSEPSRTGATPAPGATVAPVQTSPGGVETVLEEDPGHATTDSEGFAAITFTTPGWHRLKAVAPGAVRSNQLYVCVAAAATDCGAIPAEDDVRQTAPGEPSPQTPAPGGPPGQGPPGPPPPAGPPPGPGGEVASARVANLLRIDGLALAPLDDRARPLRFAGPWRRRGDPGAWRGTVTVGGAGARLRVRLGRGRALVILRDVPRTATLAETVAGCRRVVRFGPLRPGASGLLRLPRQGRAGTVELRVLRGTVGVDGVADTD